MASHKRSLAACADQAPDSFECLAALNDPQIARPSSIHQAKKCGFVAFESDRAAQAWGEELSRAAARFTARRRRRNGGRA
jgi:hypothetical protein